MITTTILRGVTLASPMFGGKASRITGFAGYYCKSTGKVAITVVAERMDRADEALRTDNYCRQVVDDVEVRLRESVNEDWEPIQGFVGEAVDHSGNKEEGADVAVYVNAVSDDTARYVGVLNDTPVTWMCKHGRELFASLGFQTEFYNSSYSPWKYENPDPGCLPVMAMTRSNRQIVRRCKVKTQVKKNFQDKEADTGNTVEAPAAAATDTRIRLEDINKLLSGNKMFIQVVNGELKLFREWHGNRTNGNRLYKHAHDRKPGGDCGKGKLNSMGTAFQCAKPSTTLNNQPR